MAVPGAPTRTQSVPPKSGIMLGPVFTMLRAARWAAMNLAQLMGRYFPAETRAVDRLQRAPMANRSH
jgi:hypothetical protein